jgi:glycosyltransferase involved in cell wall biosynthesis
VRQELLAMTDSSAPNDPDDSTSENRPRKLSGQHDREQLSDQDRLQMLRDWLSPAVCRRLGIYAIPEKFLLSVIMPVYNEKATVLSVIERVRATDIPLEIIVVDDGSTDGTTEMLQSLRGEADVRIVTHSTNQGKGAALRSGLKLVQGSVVVVQDADFEYDPSEFRLLLQPILEDRADVVYGSRYAKPDHQVDRFWHQNGNRLITLLSNLFTNLKLTDVETCYKMMRSELILSIAPNLQERGFGVELEITAKLARQKNVRFFEVPISYQSRTYAEGKKIHWKDALWALWCIVKY